MNEKKFLDDLQVLLNERKFDEVISKVRAQKSLSKDKQFALVGSVELKKGNLEKAEDWFTKALAINPSNGLAVQNMTQLLTQLGQYARTAPIFRKLLDANPKNESNALNYSLCLTQLDRFEEAVDVLRPFYEDHSPSKRICASFASVLRGNLQFSEALDVVNRSLVRFGDETDILRAKAEILTEIDPKEASRVYSELDKRGELSVTAQWNRSFNELRQRNYELGWKLYEHGLDDSVGKVGRPIPTYLKHLTRVLNCADLDPDKYTFLTVEQGIGDQIFFLGILREFIKKFPNTYLVCERRLQKLYRRSFPVVDVIDYGAAGLMSMKKGHVNGWVPIGSLLKHFRNSTESFKSLELPYLHADPKKVSEYRGKITAAHPRKRIVGISWQGGYWKRQIGTKSIDFSELMEHAKSDEIYISLQYGDTSVEKKMAKERGYPVVFINGIDFKKDIDAWAALIASCDRVLSVSTAAVHFAAAMGMPVQLLLTTHKSPFVWGDEEGVSDIYPTVTRYRPRASEKTADMLERAKNER